MNILIVNYEYPPLGGGGGVATKQLAEELAKRHEVHVLTTRYGTLPATEVIQGVHLHRIGVLRRKELAVATLASMLSFVPMAFFVGWRLCRQHKFDVLNAQFVVPSGVPGAMLAKMFGIPFVLSFIGGDVYDPSKGVSPHRHVVLRWLVRRIAGQAVECTAISQDTAQRAESLHGVVQPITVTPLGLVPCAVANATRNELHLPEGVPLFVTVGRLIPRKKYEVLLEAWKSIADAHLAIVGGGPLKKKLQELISEGGLSDRVHMLGLVEEQKKMQILRAADAYVSATEHEGFGIVFLEAMEAGLPIVTTDNGGQRDFLIEGENAVLVPINDAKQLAAAVRWLLRDAPLRQRMSQANMHKVKHFYLEHTARMFEEVLEKAAASQREG